MEAQQGIRNLFASMAMLPSGSTAVICNGCRKVPDDRFTRHVCLICEKFNQCTPCFASKLSGGHPDHRSYHPAQAIESQKQFLGEIPGNMVLYTCSLCGQEEIPKDKLFDHCEQFHAESQKLVHCPLCVTFERCGRRRLLQHLRDDHLNTDDRMACRVCHKPTKGDEMFVVCLICEKYQLCETCHGKKAQTDPHEPYHPMQEVALAREHPDLITNLCCPYCGISGIGVHELTEHCQVIHKSQEHKVICPVCTALRVPTQRSYHVVGSLLKHLTKYHRTAESIDRAGTALPDCSICQEELTDYARSLRCGHRFHDRCIAAWLESHNTCPVCRQEQRSSH